jgi:hypothetical protein
MEYYSRSALSDVIRNTELESRTSIEYMRLHYIHTSNATSIEVHDTFEDGILSQVIVEGQATPLVNDQNHHSLAPSSYDRSTTQILYVEKARCS